MTVQTPPAPPPAPPRRRWAGPSPGPGAVPELLSHPQPHLPLRGSRRDGSRAPWPERPECRPPAPRSRSRQWTRCARPSGCPSCGWSASPAAARCQCPGGRRGRPRLPGDGAGGGKGAVSWALGFRVSVPISPHFAQGHRSCPHGTLPPGGHPGRKQVTHAYTPPPRPPQHPHSRSALSTRA